MPLASPVERNSNWKERVAGRIRSRRPSPIIFPVITAEALAPAKTKTVTIWKTVVATELAAMALFPR